MDLKEKAQRAIKKNRKYFIIFAVLWLLLIAVFVTPVTYGIVKTTYVEEGTMPISVFIDAFGEAISNPFGMLPSMFGPMYFSMFLKVLVIFSGIYIIALTIGFVRSAPKHEYSDIEHGSSGWAENGEQYKILNKKEGIILGEDNYLPLDKRGNVNVLVVGRIRFSESLLHIPYQMHINV